MRPRPTDSSPTKLLERVIRENPDVGRERHLQIFYHEIQEYGNEVLLEALIDEMCNVYFDQAESGK